MAKLQETLDKLNKKAYFYEEQIKFYQQFTASCLEQLTKASAGRKGRVRPGQQAAAFKRQSVKYNAQKLHEEGILLEIEGLPNRL